MVHPVALPPVPVVATGTQQPLPPAGGRVPPLRISTARLMGGRREIVLQHGLEEYRLRITSAGKLLLTK